MADTRAVQTCHWGTPTLFLIWPLWCEAAVHEWSCTRTAAPRMLDDATVCRGCPYWMFDDATAGARDGVGSARPPAWEGRR